VASATLQVGDNLPRELANVSVSIGAGMLFVKKEKIENLKRNLILQTRLSPTLVKLDFKGGGNCFVECKVDKHSDALEAAVNGCIGSGSKAPLALGSVLIPARSNAVTSSPVKVSASRRSHLGDDLGDFSGNNLASFGSKPLDKYAETPPAAGGDVSAKRQRIDDHAITLNETRRTPEKSTSHARFAYGPTFGQQNPRRERPQQSSMMQSSRNHFSSSVQSSAAYRGYRQNLTFGLQNLGNTCYLNAVMQALCSLREFVSDLREMPITIPQVAEGQIWSGSSEILRQMSSNATAATAQGPLSPAKLRELIAKASPMFGGNQQQDAHEFLLEYINQLHDELVGARKVWLDAQSLSADSEKALPSTQLHLDSEVQKTLRCLQCNETREVCERFRDFSLDFPPPPMTVDVGSEEKRCQLSSMLGNYFKSELLEAKCEHCCGPAAEMSKSMTSEPQVLVLHLKRFVPNVQLQRYEKQHQDVEIPLQFHLKSYLQEAYAGTSGAETSLGLGKATLPARPMAGEIAAAAAAAAASLDSSRSTNASWEVMLSGDWMPFLPDEARHLEDEWARDAHGCCQ